MSAQCIVGVSYFRIINYKKLKRECLRNYCVRSGENLGFQFDKVSICLQKSINKNIVSIFAKSNARHDCHALYRRTSFRWHVLLFVSLTSFLTSSLACTYDEKGLCVDKFLDDFTGLSARVHDEQVSLDLDKVSWRVLLLVCTTNKFYVCKFTCEVFFERPTHKQISVLVGKLAWLAVEQGSLSYARAKKNFKERIACLYGALSADHTLV